MLIRSMQPATAQNRPLYINLYRPGHYQQYEYRTTLVNGVKYWVLRPVYRLAYWVQRLIRRIRAGCDFWMAGYQVYAVDGGANLSGSAYMVDLETPRLQAGIDY